VNGRLLIAPPTIGTDVADTRQEHKAGGHRSSATSRSRLPISASCFWADWPTRYRSAPIQVDCLGSRVLLASARGLLDCDNPQEQQVVLAHEVRRKRQARSQEPGQASKAWMARLCDLGMPGKFGGQVRDNDEKGDQEIVCLAIALGTESWTMRTE